MRTGQHPDRPDPPAAGCDRTADSALPGLVVTRRARETDASVDAVDAQLGAAKAIGRLAALAAGA